MYISISTDIIKEKIKLKKISQKFKVNNKEYSRILSSTFLIIESFIS